MGTVPDWAVILITAVIFISWGMTTWTWLEAVRTWLAVRKGEHRLQQYAILVVGRVTTLQAVMSLWAGVALWAWLSVPPLPPWMGLLLGIATPLLLAGVAWHEYRAMVRIYLDS